ncbi:MAG: hypothetical protein A2Y15_04440 [Clostridiales bacterium GWF2_36_10]|nr:MAG: hypothetical protein A2Y15_04440 [Clostridiales bacterium GWF2_36_10]
MENIIIIPAYNPDEKLILLINSLLKAQYSSRIIVVNDGSAQTSTYVFSKIKEKIVLLEHPINQGKGAAIKTALKYIAQNFEGENYGIITVDADGQHSPVDCERLLAALEVYPDSLLLGVRTFSGDIPWKSRWGNKITRFVFRILSGANVSDTQTGLRAFTVKLIPFLLEVSGDRYEYEMNMLASSTKKKIKITEIPIETIYIDEKNTTSHFRVIKDSLRVYGSLFLYAGSSFLSFLLDYLAFNLFAWVFCFFSIQSTAILTANIIARILSSSFNYYINSTYVFDKGSGKSFFKKNTAVKYFMLAGAILVVNSLILRFLTDHAGLSKAIAKLVTELILSIASYSVQKFIIFKVKK